MNINFIVLCVHVVCFYGSGIFIYNELEASGRHWGKWNPLDRENFNDLKHELKLISTGKVWTFFRRDIRCSNAGAVGQHFYEDHGSDLKGWDPCLQVLLIQKIAKLNLKDDNLKERTNIRLSNKERDFSILLTKDELSQAFRPLDTINRAICFYNPQYCPIPSPLIKGVIPTYLRIQAISHEEWIKNPSKKGIGTSIITVFLSTSEEAKQSGGQSKGITVEKPDKRKKGINIVFGEPSSSQENLKKDDSSNTEGIESDSKN